MYGAAEAKKKYHIEAQLLKRQALDEDQDNLANMIDQLRNRFEVLYLRDDPADESYEKERLRLLDDIIAS